MNKVYVAVVIHVHGPNNPRSHREEGDWACFVDTSEDYAITRAQQAIAKWTAVVGKPSDYYDIYVGELTHVALPTASFRKVSFEEALSAN